MNVLLVLAHPDGAAGPPVTLTLADALSRARQNDAQFQAVRSDAELARDDRIQARAAITVEDGFSNVSTPSSSYALGTDGSDSLTGTGAAVVYGFDGADSIAGGSGADTLFGGAGLDTITGGGGVDTIDGGAGNDIYLIAAGDHPTAEIADSGGDAIDIVRFTSTSAQTLTLHAGDVGIEQVNISDAAGVATGTTAENINAAASGNALVIAGNDGANTLTGTAFEIGRAHV